MGFGLTCFFTTFTPSTTMRSSSTRCTTAPRLPLSRPVNTMTWSPLRILFISCPSTGSMLLTCRPGELENLGGQRHDLHEALGTQFTRDRAEDAGADGFELGVEQDGSVAVELHQRAVLTTDALGRTNDHGAVDFALLDAATRCSFFDADLDDVANTGVTTLGTAEH